ncbi:glycosyltransferase involved in cell wall biosynthesis [Thiobaca trueperi]|uniref:Glycosyltransferase involved in cell wall biosynthesis n=1 Tax=Thiobaca trueperi TaxID=127458 RepID=A0A4R3MYY3_9GAMM|nr:glycosyltransferase involved in cell wall biosynthesis [Thiobaca trueperi]
MTRLPHTQTPCVRISETLNSRPLPDSNGVIPAPLAVFASFSGAGGVERMLINLLHGFVDLGQPVDLVMVRAESPHLARLPPEVNPIHLNVTHTLAAIPALARYLRQRRPAALLAAKDRAGRTAVLARALAGTDTRLVLRLGTNLSTAMADRTPVERWLRYAPIRLLYPRIDRIVAVSNGVAEDTARIARLPRERIQVIRNPVITPDLTIQAAAPCPHPWLMPDQPPVIMGVGRLQRQKDFPTLIRAFAQVRATRDCRLLILGEGGARAGLESLIAELGLTDSVELPGFQDNPYAWLARARLFVLSSAWEGSPNVLTEAMALGVPVVATDCPSGPAEILDGGRIAPLVPLGDVSALADAMQGMLEQPTPAARLRAAVADYEQAQSAAHYLEVLGASSIAGRDDA